MTIGQHVAKTLAARAAEQNDAAETPASAPAASAPETVNQSDFLAAMRMLLQEIRGVEHSAEAKARLALEAERLLLEQERVKREMPENKQAPGISVYSYPEGEMARPKAEFKCKKVYWIGYDMTTETLTPHEIDLVNRLEPGDYRVTKSDGTVIPFKVTAKHNDRFQLEELAVWFPSKGEHRHNHGSMVSYIQQALGEKIPTAEELLAEVTRLRAELAQERAGVGA